MKNLCLSQPKIRLNPVLNIKKLTLNHKFHAVNVLNNFIKMNFSKNDVNFALSQFVAIHNLGLLIEVEQEGENVSLGFLTRTTEQRHSLCSVHKITFNMFQHPTF